MLIKKIVVIALSLLCAACATSVPIPVAEELQPVTATFTPQAEKNFFSALFLVDDNDGNRLRYAIQHVAPSKMRIELFPTTSFYQLGLLVINDGQYVFRTPEAQKESGIFTPEVLKDKIGLQFSMQQLVSAITQDIPKDVGTYRVYTDGQGQMFLFADNGSFIGVFSGEVLQPKEFYYFNDDELAARINFNGSFTDCHSQVLIPKYDVTLSIECMSFKTDRIPSEERFLLQ